MTYSSKHFEITDPFWDGRKTDETTGEDGKKCKKVIQLRFDQTGMEAAIERATVDLMARTLTPTGTEEKFSENVIEPLRKKLEEWFIPRDQITAELYDQWHTEACNVVLDILRQHYYNDKSHNPVQYGKAQKIVNMTMKTLYCLQGSEEYEDHFDHCHLALDSFTLEWFKRNVIPWCEECYNTWIKAVQEAAYDSELGKHWLKDRGKRHKETVMREILAACPASEAAQLAQYLRQHMPEPVTIKETAQLSRIPEPYWEQIREEELRKIEAAQSFPARLTGSRMISWSVLPRLGGYDYGYDDYVRWIRIYFATNHTYTDRETGDHLTAFQAEFYIWPENQLELAAEVLYGQDIGKKDAVEDVKNTDEWHRDKVAEMDFDAQFKWCQERFKNLPLDQKMVYLSNRISHLKRLFSDARTPVAE